MRGGRIVSEGRGLSIIGRGGGGSIVSEGRGLSIIGRGERREDCIRGKRTEHYRSR